MTPARPPADAPLTDHLRHWARHRPQQQAFSHVDFPDTASRDSTARSAGGPWTPAPAPSPTGW